MQFQFQIHFEIEVAIYQKEILIMTEIIDILMLRDGISENEAYTIINECKEELMDAVYRGNYLEAEDIIASYLGLEPDYLDIFLNEML